MKSNGQLVYEYTYPPKIEVVPFVGRKWATRNDIIVIDNPSSPTPWRFLSKKSQESWEVSAKGHHLTYNNNNE